MDFSGAPLQRLINLNDLLRSRDFGVGDLLSDQPYMVPTPFFSHCQFSYGKNRRRDEVAAGLLAVHQSRLEPLPALPVGFESGR